MEDISSIEGRMSRTAPAGYWKWERDLLKLEGVELSRPTVLSCRRRALIDVIAAS